MTKSFFLIVLFLFTSITHAQLADPGFTASVTEGRVETRVTAIQADGKIIVGGGFSLAGGIEKNTLARLNADGTLDASFNASGIGPSGIVLDIKVLPDGKILISGTFTGYNGTEKRGIARLNSDGTLDLTFNASGVGSTGNIHTIEPQPDGKILLSGTISSYNGTPRFSVIRLNSDGTLDDTFTSPFTGPQFVEEVDLQADGKVLIGGSFSIGTPTRTNVARLNADGSLDTSFNAAGGGATGTGSAVFAMDVQSDGKIVIGGAFTDYNGTPRNSVARLNSDGTLDMAFTFTNAVTPRLVEHFAIRPDGQIFAAGLFASGPNTFGLVRVSTTGSLTSAALVSVDNLAYHVILQPDGKPIVSGFFNRVASTPGRNLVRLNTNDLVDTSFTPQLIGFGYGATLARQPDGKIIVAGNFSFANGTARSSVARFNADGSLDTTFDPGSGPFPDLFLAGGSNSNLVFATAVQSDGKILIGGSFGGYNGVERRAIVRLNSDGSLDTSFEVSAIATRRFAVVNDILVLADGKIMIAGTFINNPDPPNHGILRLNPDGSIDGTFNSTANSTIQRVRQLPDGKFMIAGLFTMYSGQSRNRIARINSDGSLDTTFAPGTGANSTVTSIVVQPDGKVVIGGAFTTFNGVARNRIVRLNTDGAIDAGFETGTGFDGIAEDLLLQADGRVIAAGRFGTYNGTVRNRLARLNADGSLDGSFVSGFDADSRFFVRRAIADGNKLVLGGLFKAYGGESHSGVVRLLSGGRAPFDFDGDGKTDIGIFRPNAGEWWINRSSNDLTFATQFGSATDSIVPADYTGDGKADVAFWRPSTGEWYVLRSEDFSFFAFPFGSNGDLPVPADYDADGKADAAVFRPSSATWFIRRSSDNGTTIEAFGANGDVPVPADYDADGKADLAIFRPASGQWWINRSTAGLIATTFGDSAVKPVQGDYTGDGKADVAFWRPSTGDWFVLRSEDFSFFSFPFGTAGDTPAPGDYDGDGKFDATVFRGSNATWYSSRTTAGTLIRQFGQTGDRPIPNAFVP